MPSVILAKRAIMYSGYAKQSVQTAGMSYKHDPGFGLYLFKNDKHIFKLALIYILKNTAIVV